jgi:hypothetical protein
MNKILLFLFVLLSASTMAQETYYVIHVKGDIISLATGKKLKTGDKITPNDKIKFNPDKAVAVLMSPKSGHFTLGKPASQKPSSTGEFISFIKTTMIPLKSNGQLSTRGNEEIIVDPRSIFASDTFVFIGNSSKFFPVGSNYPMTNQKHFVYSFKYQGKPYNKKVAYSKDTLIIEPKALYVVSGQPILPTDASNVEVYYYDAKEKSSIKIASFKPVFYDEETARQELGEIIKVCAMQKISKDQVIEQLYDYIEALYGSTDKHMLHQWVVERFTLQ